jgi:hypothetical protein
MTWFELWYGQGAWIMRAAKAQHRVLKFMFKPSNAYKLQVSWALVASSSSGRRRTPFDLRVAA